MNIVVLVKQVPDTAAERTLTEVDHTLDRENTDLVLDEINERAAEEALTLKEATDAEVTVVSMGPDSALDAIRKVLAMGADRGIHIRDDRLQGADVVTTARSWPPPCGRWRTWTWSSRATRRQTDRPVRSRPS